MRSRPEDKLGLPSRVRNGGVPREAWWKAPAYGSGARQKIGPQTLTVKQTIAAVLQMKIPNYSASVISLRISLEKNSFYRAFLGRFLPNTKSPDAQQKRYWRQKIYGSMRKI